MEEMEIQYMKETGLIVVSIYGQTVELCIEDIEEINDIVQGVNKKNIAHREDFI